MPLGTRSHELKPLAVATSENDQAKEIYRREERD